MTGLPVVPAAIDPAFVAIAILFLSSVVVGVVVSRVRNAAMVARLGRVAARLGGTLVHGNMFSQPGIAFKITGRGARLEVFSGARNNPPYTRVVVELQGVSPGTFHVLEQGFGQAFLKLFGAQDLEIGDPVFDREYVVKATPESLASRLFSPDRRREGMQIVRRLRGRHDPTFDLTSGALTVTVREYLADEADVMALIDATKEFADFVFRPAAVVLGEVKTAGGGACPVCGTVLQDLIVRCESCRTPHHYECWKYMGRCSTFGCKGNRAQA